MAVDMSQRNASGVGGPVLASKKVAIVTGASYGLGRTTAEALARAGYIVFGTSRKVRDDGPQGVTLLPCDVTSDESVQALVAKVLAQTGRIDLLVNNAGVGLRGAAEEASLSEVQALYDVNLFGVVRMTNAVLPTMRRQLRGRIITIGSILGIIPAPFLAHYAATKHAIEGYSESLDHELRSLNIRAIVVEPGVTKSAFDDNTVTPAQSFVDYDAGRLGAKQAIEGMMRTADEPEVVARTVVRAATVRKPSIRYAAGSAKSVSVLHRFLPRAVFDRQIHKMMRLPG